MAYGELGERVRRLARYLRDGGVASDVRVGVCIPRSPDLVVAILAILEAGGAYVPLDPALPPARIAALVERAGCRLVLRDAEAPESGAARLIPGGHPDDLAYVMFTSGSSGEPKGVMMAHRAVDNRLRWMQREFALGVDDRVLHKTSIGFDVSVWELNVVRALPGVSDPPGK
jgi:non-ribosomal peptide synthetase component F